MIIAAAKTRGSPAVFLAARHHGQLSFRCFRSPRRKVALFKPLAFTKTFSMFFAAISRRHTGSSADDVC